MKVTYRFKNEFGNSIQLICSKKAGRSVHIRMVGPTSIGDWAITSIEAKKLVKGLLRVMK